MTDALADFAFVVLGLATATLAGWPFVGVLERLGVRAAHCAAPVLGYSWFAVAATWAYRAGAPAWTALLALLVPGAIAVWRRRPALDRRAVLSCWGGALSLALLLLAARWAGGARFAIFQGNAWDQRNYVVAATVYARASYGELAGPLVWAGPDTDVLNNARRNLHYRPSVSIAAAAVLPWLRAPWALSLYAYLVLLLALWYWALALALDTLGPGTTPGRGLALLAVAGAGGFYGQYVLDLNAWSQLSAVPLALVALSVLGRLLAQAEEAPSVGTLAWASVALVAPLPYLYPELLPAYGSAFVLALLAAYGWGNGPRLPRAALAGFALGLLGTLLVAWPYWHGTGDFLQRQFTRGAALQHLDAWFDTFWQHLRGLDAADWQGPLGRLTLTGRLVAWIDALAGLLGLPFMLPPVAWPRAARLVTRLALLAALVAPLAAAVRHTWRRWQVRDPAALLLSAAPFGALLPIVTAALGFAWQAGKLWSMLAPLVFVWLVAPLVGPGGRRAARAPAWLFVAAQLAFLLARPLAAAAPQGAFRPSPPYPRAQPADLKERYSWDLAALSHWLSGCSQVAIALPDPLLRDFVQALAIERRATWWSPDWPAGPRLFSGARPAGAPPAQPPPCLVNAGAGAAPGTGRVFSLAARDGGPTLTE